MTQKYTLPILAFILPALVWLSACSAPGGEPLPAPPVANIPPPQVWLEWPPDGSEQPMEEMEVQAQVHDPGGQGIAQVQFLINGQVVKTTELTQTGASMVYVPVSWQPAEPGDYIIEVRAVSRAGRSGEPATARVSIAKKEVKISFTADKLTLKYDDCTNLHWTVENAQEVKLDDKKVDFTGSSYVCLKASTTYRLVALSLYGEPVEQTLTLTMPPTPESPHEVVITFEADKSNYKQYGDSITLVWTVNRASSVKLEGINDDLGLQGSLPVRPTEPVNVYRLIVESPEGEVFEKEVVVEGFPTPTPIPTPTSTATPTPTPTFTPSPTISPTPITPTPILPSETYLTANPNPINQGQCTNLIWHHSVAQP